MRRCEAVVLVALVSGCGGTVNGRTDLPPDGGPADAIAPIVTAEQACARYSDVYCLLLQACEPIVIRIYFGTLDRCRSHYTSVCPAMFLLQGTTMTPDRQMACANGLEATTCEQLALRAPTPAVCESDGELTSHEACGSTWQCAEGCCTQKQVGELCGVCTPQGPEGASCTKSGGCQPYLLCTEAGLCVSPGQLAASCDPDHPCRRDLACFNNTCAPLGQPGEPCGPDNTCDSNVGLYCDPWKTICRTFEYAAPGEPCGMLQGQDGLYTICTAGSDCEFDSGLTGSCKGPLKPGAPCDPETPLPACELPTFCVGGVCQIPHPETCK